MVLSARGNPTSTWPGAARPIAGTALALALCALGAGCSAPPQLVELTFHAGSARGQPCAPPPPALDDPQTLLVDWDLENSDHHATELAAADPASCDVVGNCTYALYQIAGSCVVPLGRVRAAAFVLSLQHPLEPMKSILTIETPVPLAEASPEQLRATVWSFDPRQVRYLAKGRMDPRLAKIRLDEARAAGTLPATAGSPPTSAMVRARHQATAAPLEVRLEPGSATP